MPVTNMPARTQTRMQLRTHRWTTTHAPFGSQVMQGIERTCIATIALVTLGLLSACDSGSTTPAVVVPGVPISIEARVGSGAIVVSFVAPTSTGGAAISGYTVVCTANGIGSTGTGTASPITVSGLTNGTAYACTVSASNAAGTSLPSGAVNVTPVGVPGVPTNVVATPGNTSISISFTAPTSTGGTPVLQYLATCTAAGVAKSTSAATSPVVVTGLTNGTAYSCVLAALNGVGTGPLSSTISATPIVPATGTTATVGCTLTYSGMNTSPKVNANSRYTWSCSGATRLLTGTGIPDHPVTGGQFATPISTQVINVTGTLNPALTGTVTPVQVIGYALNSVKFDPGTAGTCTSNATGTALGQGCVAIAGQDPWRIEALGGAFTFGTDENNAHVQPDGAYHYHGMPEGVITKQAKGTGMTLVGWAADGFPIYARYGYTVADNAASGTRSLKGSYPKKATPSVGRPSVSIFPMGTFQQDYEYVAGSGDLDECNGRTGVTPEFPNGIYHYYVTETYPYIQRCVKGTATRMGPPPPP